MTLFLKPLFKMKPIKLLTIFLTLTAVSLAGCKKNSAGALASNKVRVGYIGLTCEAPILPRSRKAFSRKKDSRSAW